MAIDTIEDAYDEIGRTLSAQHAQRTRQALAAKGRYEVTIVMLENGHGYVATTRSEIASDRRSHGRFIRLK